MALIDDVVSIVLKIPVGEDHVLTLRPDQFGMPLMHDFFHNVLESDQLVIARAERKQSEGGIVISGQSTLWKYKDHTLSVWFLPGPEDTVTAKTELSLLPEEKKDIPLVEWLELRDTRLVTCIDGTHGIIDHSFHGHIDTLRKEKNIPICIRPVSATSWRIDAGEETNIDISAEELVKLIGGRSVSSFLPQQLTDALNGISVTGIHSVFDYPEKNISFFQVGMMLKNGWTIAPKLELKPGLGLTFTISAPGTPFYELTANVTGTIDLHGTPMPLFIDISVGNSNSLGLGIQPGKSIVLPSVSSLLHLADADNAFDFPDGLKELKQIAIKRFIARFDLDQKKMASVEFEIGTVSSWTIIAGYFEITSLSIGFDISGLNQDHKDISGFVTGCFLIKEVALRCSLQKQKGNSDWIITAGLATGRTISLTQIASQLFGKITPPSEIPDFSFSKLLITVVPKTKRFSFDAQSADTWKFTDNLSVSGFALNFKRDPDDQEHPVKGHIGAKIIVGTTKPVTITLSAALNETQEGGWQFEGSTDKELIEVDHLVEYIAKSFGIKTKAPDWLKGITLSEIGVGFNTATKNFHFKITGEIPVGDKSLVITINFRLEKDGDHYQRHLDGKLTIGKDAEVILSIDSSSSDTLIRGEWHAKTPEGNLRFEDLAATLGFKKLPAIPDALKFALTDVSFLYDSSEKLVVIGAKTAGKSAAVFVSSTLRDKSRFYGFGANIQLNVRLADIPLVGDKIPGADNIGIPEATAWILSAPLIADDVTDINNYIGKGELPLLPSGPLHARVLLHAVLHLGATQEKPLDLALGNTAPHSTLSVAENSEPPSAPTWIDIQKQFGVFIFNRIGFAYHDNQLQFLLDAGMEMGPLSFSLDGLSISSPLNKFEPHFDLSGLGIAYHQGSLAIEGALLKLPKEQLDPNTKFQFDGLAVIKAGKFSLSAVGLYSQLKSGDPSMFLFVQVEAPIGGPPAFFITGVMGGFGFNRSLAIPGMDEVTAFPLLSLAEPPSPEANAETQKPLHVLDVLSGREPAKKGGEKRAWIAASAGEYWLALGLQFTSFQIVRSRALLIAEFGHDLSFALLGLSTLQLPQTSDGKHPYVFAELQLRAVLQPNEGFFGLSALLSGNSFVLTPDCHLTGGFALYFWFGPHAMSGQFVVSMGGYHPAFDKPKDYPTLPRLGFNWAVSSSLTIKGGAYFALTPSCVMAGGALEALFHDGCVKAWFTAHADFLIAWRPFFFTASIGVSIGVEVNFGSDDSHAGSSYSVSADVEMWGPPTGGRAHVHVIFISFTVHFGSDDAASNNKALPWHEFNELLPHSAAVCRIIASDGISQTKESGKSTSGKAWIVRSGSFRFVTESAIPSSEISYGEKHDQTFSVKNSAGGNPIDIRPMNKTGVRSEHRLKIFKDNKPVNCEAQGWTLNPRSAKTPEALWGKPPASFSQIPGSPKADMTGELLNGYEVIAPRPSLGSGPGAVPVKSLLLDYLSPEGKTALRSAEPPNPDYLPAFNENSIDALQKISGTEAQAARKKMSATLLDLGLYSGANESMSRLGNECTHLYDTAPLLQ